METIRSDGPRAGLLLAGVAAIIAGIAFIARAPGALTATAFNWWAIFLFVPLAGLVIRLWRLRQPYDTRARIIIANQLMVGMFILLTALILLLGLPWGAVWPLYLIVMGVSLLLRALILRL